MSSWLEIKNVGSVEVKSIVGGSVTTPEKVYERELEFKTFKNFPEDGNENYLYISTDENSIYRFDGLKGSYIQVAGNVDLSECVSDKENNSLVLDAEGKLYVPTIEFSQSDERNFTKNPIDLSSEVTGKLSFDMVESPNIFSGSYDDLTDKPEIPLKVSELVNDSGFVAFETDPVYMADKENIALKSELFSKNYDDLTDKPSIPSKISELVNDSGFVAFETDPVYMADKENIALKSELFSKNYDDLTDKPSIPSRISELVNDSGFTGDETVSVHKTDLSIHVTELEKENWDNKADKVELNSLSQKINDLSELSEKLDGLNDITEKIDELDEISARVNELSDFVGFVSSDAFGIEVDFSSNLFTRLAGAVGKTAGTDFDDVECFGGRKRCIVADNGSILAYYGDSGYTETGKLEQEIVMNSISYPIGTTVQVMVYQPRFYYKVVPLTITKASSGLGNHARKAQYYVSFKKLTGFKLHPAFIKNGIEKPYVLIGAYNGCVYKPSSGSYNLLDEQNADFAIDKLSSIAGVKPVSGLSQNLTRRNCGILAENRGDGWSQLYGAIASCTQLLFVIEYCAFNSQSALGKSVADKSSGTGNESLNTGATSSLGNKSGSSSGSNGVASISYRGQENPWGNIYEFLDGVNIYPYSINEIFIADHDFAESKTDEHYTSAGFTLAKTSNYMSAFGYNENGCDWLFFPSEAAGNSSLPVGDYLTQKNTETNGFLVPVLGGDWSNGLNAGLFRIDASIAVSGKARNYSGRLVYVP